MASLQQYHEQFEVDKLTRELVQLKSSIEDVKLGIEEIKCSIKEELKRQREEMKYSLFEFQKAVNQVLQSPQLQSSALPSDASVLPSKAEPSASRSFWLDLKGELPETLFTKSALEDEGFSLTLELRHDTGERVCPESWMKDLKVEYNLIKGDFMVEERHDWTVEDYNNHVVTPREGKPALLDGNCKVSLSEGSARVCGMSITDNSKSIRNGYRLGAQVIGGLPSGWTVRPAVSKAFRVKEDRNRSDQKHPTPFPKDELYRLRNISRTGPIYRRAEEKQVITVMDFLQLYHTNAEALEKIFGNNGKKWKDTVNNAKACILTNERYKYRYHDNASGDVLLLKCDFNIESVTFNGQTSQPYESLDEGQKKKVNRLRKAAYDKRKEITKEYEPINQAQDQAGLEYPHVEQQPQEKKQQPSSSVLPPLPFAPPPSNMDPNVLDISDQRPICGTTVRNSYLDSYQQDFMNASNLFTGECEVHNTDMGLMGVGNRSSVPYEVPTEQFAHYSLDPFQCPSANLDEIDAYINEEQMFDYPQFHTAEYNIGSEGFGELDFTDGVQKHTHHEEVNKLPSKRCKLYR